jgi:hypothetical protein
MPITFSENNANGWLETKATGLVTHDEIREHLKVEDERRALGRAEIFDARGAWTNLTADEIRDLVYVTGALQSRERLGPTAIIAQSDLVYGMARMYEILLEGKGVPVGVFRTLPEGEKWLAAKAPQQPPAPS